MEELVSLIRNRELSQEKLCEIGRTLCSQTGPFLYRLIAMSLVYQLDVLDWLTEEPFYLSRDISRTFYEFAIMCPDSSSYSDEYAIKFVYKTMRELDFA